MGGLEVRYQAALRPDICCSLDSRPLPVWISIPSTALILTTSQNRLDTRLVASSPYQNSSRTGGAFICDYCLDDPCTTPPKFGAIS